MVACQYCTAKFSSAVDIEARWLETHLSRFHEQTRATQRPFFESLGHTKAA
jgi:hypothetical protein